jgi:hypothetical protein
MAKALLDIGLYFFERIYALIALLLGMAKKKIGRNCLQPKTENMVVVTTSTPRMARDIYHSEGVT